MADLDSGRGWEATDYGRGSTDRSAAFSAAIAGAAPLSPRTRVSAAAAVIPCRHSSAVVGPSVAVGPSAADLTDGCVRHGGVAARRSNGGGTIPVSCVVRDGGGDGGHRHLAAA